MNALDILIDVARRPRDAAEALRVRLAPGRLNAHPHHDNSIAWLLWHAAREIDEQLAAISGGVTVWRAQGYVQRFGFDVRDREHGHGHAPDEARAVQVGDAGLLLDHLSDVIDAQIAYLESLDPSELARVVDDSWEPPVTLASRMVSISVDAAEHVAQAAYITGMGGGAFE